MNKQNEQTSDFLSLDENDQEGKEQFITQPLRDFQQG